MFKAFTPHHFFNCNITKKFGFKTNKRNHRSGGGFTLIELMVVMAIIIIMTTIVLINYRAGGQQLALNRSANKLAQDIRRAQEMAMSASVCEKCGNIVPDRYGIYIASPLDAGGDHTRPDSYILFADTDDTGMFWVPWGDEEIEEITFERGVYLYNATSCDLSTVNTQHHNIHLTFKPPDPVSESRVGHPPAIPEQVGCPDGIGLILRVEGSDQQRKVKVNQAGLIYVE